MKKGAVGEWKYLSSERPTGHQQTIPVREESIPVLSPQSDVCPIEDSGRLCVGVVSEPRQFSRDYPITAENI